MPANAGTACTGDTTMSAGTYALLADGAAVEIRARALGHCRAR